PTRRSSDLISAFPCGLAQQTFYSFQIVVLCSHGGSSFFLANAARVARNLCGPVLFLYVDSTHRDRCDTVQLPPQLSHCSGRLFLRRSALAFACLGGEPVADVAVSEVDGRVGCGRRAGALELASPDSFSHGPDLHTEASGGFLQRVHAALVSACGRSSGGRYGHGLGGLSELNKTRCTFERSIPQAVNDQTQLEGQKPFNLGRREPD